MDTVGLHFVEVNHEHSHLEQVPDPSRGTQRASSNQETGEGSTCTACNAPVQSDTLSVDTQDTVIHKHRRLRVSRRFTISITLAGVAVSGLTLWPSYRSMRYDSLSVALARWTAEKDFLEYCAAHGDGPPSKQCRNAQKAGLSAPPGMTVDQDDMTETWSKDIERTDLKSSRTSAVPMQDLPSKSQTITDPPSVTNSAENQANLPSKGFTIPVDAAATQTLVALIGYTSESPSTSYRPWSCTDGQILASDAALNRCPGSGMGNRALCTTGMVTNTPIQETIQWNCWPSSSAPAVAWDATRTASTSEDTSTLHTPSRSTTSDSVLTNFSLDYISLSSSIFLNSNGNLREDFVTLTFAGDTSVHRQVHASQELLFPLSGSLVVNALLVVLNVVV